MKNSIETLSWHRHVNKNKVHLCLETGRTIQIHEYIMKVNSVTTINSYLELTIFKLLIDSSI